MKMTHYIMPIMPIVALCTPRYFPGNALKSVPGLLGLLVELLGKTTYSRVI